MLCASVIFGCKSRNNSDQDTATSGFVANGDMVTVDETSALAQKLVLETIQLQDISSKFNATASVSPRPDSYAEVASPFGGRVSRILVRLGDRVYRGQALYEITSADFMEAVKEYVENSNSVSVASSNLRRKQALHESGIVSDKDLEEAQSACSDAEAALALSKQVLSTFGVNPASAKVGQPLRVLSPISGVVVKNNLVLGQILSDDEEAPVAVADLSSVWVTANVKESMVQGIAKGQTVSIESSGQTVSQGSVRYVGEMLDMKTRTVPVVIECGNAERTLKPGMFVSAVFSKTVEDAVTVPSSAVFQGDGSKFVYVCQDGLVFKKVPVETENLSTEVALVTEGLKGGETVITKGGIYLSH